MVMTNNVTYYVSALMRPKNTDRDLNVDIKLFTEFKKWSKIWRLDIHHNDINIIDT